MPFYVEVRYRTLVDGLVGESVVLIEDASGTEKLLEILATDAPFGATIHHRNTAQFAELVVGLRGEAGALYYTDKHGSWYSYGPTPEDDGPVFAEGGFPAHCELPGDAIGSALAEFIGTGVQRPDSVEWQDDPDAVRPVEVCNITGDTDLSDRSEARLEPTRVGRTPAPREWPSAATNEPRPDSKPPPSQSLPARRGHLLIRRPQVGRHRLSFGPLPVATKDRNASRCVNWTESPATEPAHSQPCRNSRPSHPTAPAKPAR